MSPPSTQSSARSLKTTKVTDYFTRRSSTAGSTGAPSSSQLSAPHSSQPGPSQSQPTQSKARTRAASIKGPVAAKDASTPRATSASKNATRATASGIGQIASGSKPKSDSLSTSTASKKPPAPDQEVISVSSRSSASVIFISDSVPIPPLNNTPTRHPPTAQLSGVEIVSPRKGTRVRVPTARTIDKNKTTTNMPDRLRSSSIQLLGSSQQQSPSQERGKNQSGPQMMLPSKRKHSEVVEDSPAAEDAEDGIVLLSSSPPSKHAGRRSFPISIPSSSVSRPVSLAPNDHIAHPTPLERLPNKKPRLMPPSASLPKETTEENLVNVDEEELVPGSQSDEQELTIPKDLRRDPREVQENVESWRHLAATVRTHSEPDPLPALELDGIAMDVDNDVGADSGKEDEKEGKDAPSPRAQLLSISFSSSLSPPSSRPSSPYIPNRSFSPTHASSAEVSALLRPMSLPSPTLPSYSIPTSAYATPMDFAHDLPPASSRAPSEPLHISTPPLTSPALPKTPVALDAKSKTAQIIAQIRAEAMKAVRLSSPEDEVASELAELDDSSGSENEGWFVTRSKKKNPDASSPRSMASSSKFAVSASASASTLTTPQSALESPESPTGASHNYKTRHQIPSPPGSSTTSPFAATRPTRKRRAPQRELAPLVSKQTIAKASAKGKKSMANPLDALLKEKLNADKAGSGMDALNRAENIDRVALFAPVDLNLDEDEDEDEQMEKRKWTDEEAAARAARRGAQMRIGLGGRVSGKGVDMDMDMEDEEEEEVDAEDRERLLGAKEGKAVGSILDADRLGGMKQVTLVGVRVWETVGTVEGEEGMDDVKAERMPELVLDEGTSEMPPALKLVCEAIEQGDADRTKRFIDAGLLRKVDLSQYLSILDWLCRFALAIQPTPLCHTAFNFLRYLPAPQTESRLSARFIADTLARLGMKSEMLERICDQDVTVPPRNRVADDDIFEEVLYRLVSLVTALSLNYWLRVEDTPDIVMALLLVGIDASASNEIRTDLLRALEAVCQRLPADLEDGSESIECAVATRVLAYASTLHVGTQALMLSFFVRASTQSSRIARCVARHLLTGADFSTDPYTDLPSLDALIDVLSETHGPFEATDTTDYEELSSRVDVLSVALTDIDGYVAQEGDVRRVVQVVEPEDSPRKGRERMPLELVKNRLDVLHGRIVDTRAAHLDRSRAKGALQRLAMRVHYQRNAVLNSGPRSLLDFWSLEASSN
ncbi:hypothetical protein EW146_g4089 [Bondarzewia mesenterica]|uniref:Uncharacterized protein n=1 Tax=Bondarzewia mesenterica TaxID=1095465 RepID=A0A4S4LVK6_9AGAM|nr:hypothetical protein EW146_g4089 [Bondarzewia mesenterica]